MSTNQYQEMRNRQQAEINASILLHNRKKPSYNKPFDAPI